MNDKADSAASRLWRDRVHVREQERNEAQAHARTAEQEVGTLRAGNEQLAMEIARLRALLPPNPAEARAETVREMADLRDALLPLLARQPDSINERDHRPCIRNRAALEQPGHFSQACSAGWLDPVILSTVHDSFTSY